MDEKRPRHYAADFIAARSKEEQQRVIDSIPAHLIDMVREHVKTTRAMQAQNKQRTAA